MNKSILWQSLRQSSWMVLLGAQIFLQVAVVGIAHHSIAIDQRRSNHIISTLSSFLLGHRSN